MGERKDSSQPEEFTKYWLHTWRKGWASLEHGSCFCSRAAVSQWSKETTSLSRTRTNHTPIHVCHRLPSITDLHPLHCDNIPPICFWDCRLHLLYPAYQEEGRFSPPVKKGSSEYTCSVGLGSPASQVSLLRPPSSPGHLPASQLQGFAGQLTQLLNFIQNVNGKVFIIHGVMWMDIFSLTALLFTHNLIMYTVPCNWFKLVGHYTIARRTTMTVVWAWHWLDS